MEQFNYIYYNDYLNNRQIKENSILVAKTNKSYLIGPRIDLDFDEQSFYKRTISTSVYDMKIYKRIPKNKVIKLFNKYLVELKSNEVIEILKNGEIIRHYIIPLPEGMYEKK